VNHYRPVREIRFIRAARKRRIGRASTQRVIACTTPPKRLATSAALAWRYMGQDNRDRELRGDRVEIGAGREAFPLVMHVKPAFRRRG
jgi:hypothetical protein